MSLLAAKVTTQAGEKHNPSVKQGGKGKWALFLPLLLPRCYPGRLASCETAGTRAFL